MSRGASLVELATFEYELAQKAIDKFDAQRMQIRTWATSAFGILASATVLTGNVGLGDC